MFDDLLGSATKLQNWQTRSINAENPTGEKGRGGMAVGDLGPSRKGSPCLNNIAPGQTVTLCSPVCLRWSRRSVSWRRF